MTSPHTVMTSCTQISLSAGLQAWSPAHIIGLFGGNEQRTSLRPPSVMCRCQNTNTAARPRQLSSVHSFSASLAPSFEQVFLPSTSLFVTQRSRCQAVARTADSTAERTPQVKSREIIFEVFQPRYLNVTVSRTDGKTTTCRRNNVWLLSGGGSY